MNKNEAYKFLEETFHASFDENKYLKFINEIFNGSFEFKRSKIFVHSSFNDYISEAYDLGRYVNKKELCVLVIKLKKSSSLERARTMQRNFVANYLKYKNTDAALIAFCDENLDDWRFSFVKVDFLINKTEKGKLKTNEEITPVKRYSYLVGRNESNHTCQKQLEKFIVEEKINPLIEDIEKSFSVDNVTKEFFEEYKKLFLRLKDSINELIETDNKIKTEFLEKDVDSISFSKKLLGQIVFLYFLQKKGWLGVTKNNFGDFNKWGSGPKDFLKQLFNKTFIDYNNFFNDVLEPLFYEALAIDRKDNNDYYSRFKCKIPFLNGGLFEPLNNYSWEKTDVLINNDIFKDIFDVFDRFNFTIKEDEPLDKEVAVDPEMLGKVFENLLDVNDRKSKGAFYTPREIVHYMCQQSLINYLETNLKKESVSKEDIEYFVVNGEYTLSELIREQEEKKHKTYGSSVNRFPLPESIKNNYNIIDKLLVNVKIADPAVGSGAFPVGMMTEIVKCRSILTFLFNEKEQKKRTNYYLKRETIENSLYGVDIEPSAVEIAKLRFWLSLIVDEEDIDNINPLPNLDHKIMCGNSLLDSFEGVKLFNNIINNKTKDKEIYQTKLFDSKSDVLFKKLQKLQKEYFNESSRTKKNELKTQIDNIEWGFIEEKLKEQNSKEALEKLQKIKKSKSKPFFIWELYFNDVFNRENPGFDIVIGNPPYIKDEEIMAIKDALKLNYDVFTGNSDIYTYFYEKGIKVLRNKGNLTYISSNKFMRAKYGYKLRSLLKQKIQLKELIDFGSTHLFEAVTNTVILILKNEFNKESVFRLKTNLSSEPILFSQKDLNEDAWSIFQDNTMSLKQKIEKKGVLLKNWGVKINYGLISGFNEAFVINQETKEKLIQISPKNIEIIKPLIRGRDIGRYYHRSKNLFLLVIPSGWTKRKFNDENLNKNNAYEHFKKEFPGVSEYMENIQKLFEKGEVKAKGKGLYTRDNKGEYWWELRDCKYYDDFKKEKIIWIELTDLNKFTYSNKEEYILAGGFMMTGESLKYLLSFLNSKLCLFYFNLICNSSGMNTTQWKKFVMDRIPIKQISLEQQKPFIQLVDQILSITKDADYLENKIKQQKVKQLEAKIDQLVYNLYELTPDEIKIIEGK